MQDGFDFLAVFDEINRLRILESSQIFREQIEDIDIDSNACQICGNRHSAVAGSYDSDCVTHPDHPFLLVFS